MNRSTLRTTLIALGTTLLVAACAGTDALAPPEGVSPALDEVRSAPDRHAGDEVRWGGTIAGVENRSETTLVEVVDRTLTRSGRPRTGDSSRGRFLAVVPGFLDPQIYKEGREVTVRGTVDGTTERPVGEHPYTYVQVQVEHHHLWEERREPRPVYRDPFFYGPGYYDPWHDPWRRGPRPYYRY